MKILVIQQKRIGDVLAGTIICNNLRRIYPDSEIHYLVYDFTKEVALNNPNIDKIISYKDEYRNNYKLFTFAFKIRKEKYDIVIDAYGKLESRIITFLSNASTRIGRKSKMKRVYNLEVPKAKYTNSKIGSVLEEKIDLIKPLIKDPNFRFDYAPKMYLDEVSQKEIPNLFPANYDFSKKTLMFGIIGSVEDKTLPLNKMLHIVNYFNNKYNLNILLNYFKNQREEAGLFYEKIEKKDSVYFDVYGETITQLTQILTKVDAYIGNDCGFTNISKACDVPTYAIFAPFIYKHDWATLENLKTNTSYHLVDYDDEVKNINIQEIRDNISQYYAKFDENQMIALIENFLKELNILS